MREALAFVKGPTGKAAESKLFLGELQGGATSLFLRNRAQDFTDELRDLIPDSDYWLVTARESGLTALFQPYQLAEAREAVYEELSQEVRKKRKLLWVAPRLAQTPIAPPMRGFIMPILKQIIDGSRELQNLGLDWGQIQILRFTLSEFDPDAVSSKNEDDYDPFQKHLLERHVQELLLKYW